MTAEETARAAARLCGAAEDRTWCGPDVFDALWKTWPSPVTGGRRRRQAVIQAHARLPVDIRRLYRRRHPRLAKALAVFALADLALCEAGAGSERLASAKRALDLLDADRSAGADAWGYPFDMQTRWSYYSRDTPNVVVTSFAAMALDAGAQAFGNDRYAARARRAAAWIQDSLFLDEFGFYAYHPATRSVIHNANLLGAGVAWRLLRDRPGVAGGVRKAVERTLRSQAPDGSFPYGEDRNLAFVDSFHTGYVLDSLCDVAEVDPLVEGAIERGAAFYRSSFFDSRGRCRLWPGKAFPEDGHSTGTALRVLARLSERGQMDSDLLSRVAERAVGCMVRGDHAVHRRYRWGRTHVSYLRWCDAHMAWGLASAARALGVDLRS